MDQGLLGRAGEGRVSWGRMGRRGLGRQAPGPAVLWGGPGGQAPGPAGCTGGPGAGGWSGPATLSLQSVSCSRPDGSEEAVHPVFHAPPSSGHQQQGKAAGSQAPEQQGQGSRACSHPCPPGCLRSAGAQPMSASRWCHPPHVMLAHGPGCGHWIILAAQEDV